MLRAIEKDLLNWKHRQTRLPLLLRGARQVGKTYIVEKLGNTHFDQLLSINFELQPELKTCFDTIEPQDILNNLSLITRKKLRPGKDLLFLDEIQDCPNAIRAMRYFKEKLPELHIIGAGSLLEFTLNDANFRMPVGRIESLYLKPLSFKEYLEALGYQDLSAYLENLTLKDTIPDVIHQQLIKLTREYMVLGGMPAVVKAYIETQDLYQCQMLQTSLLNTYRNDFGKYANKIEHKYLQHIFEKIPGFVAEQIKYSKIDADMRSREIKTALKMLEDASLIYPIYATTASGIPLISLINEKKFKLLFLDVGLMMRSSQLETELLFKEDLLLVHRGKLAEQFVGQELLASFSATEKAQIFFWAREKSSSIAEVDFITNVYSQIVPIEVKAGTTGTLKSLQLFMNEKQTPLGVRISQLPFSSDGKILSLPFYMVNELSRLVKL